MQALQINFAPRRGVFPAWGVVALLLAISACGYFAHVYRSLSSELETREAQWRRTQKALNARAEPAAIPTGEWARLQAEVKTGNRVIRQISFPWDDLFHDIEASVTENVALLSVEPDPEKREIRITAEAKDFNAMLDYESRLDTISLFENAHISNHQLQLQDPQRPVRFIATAQWAGRSVSEK